MYLSESKLFLPIEVKSLICESRSGSTGSGSAFAAAAAAPEAAPVAVFACCNLPLYLYFDFRTSYTPL